MNSIEEARKMWAGHPTEYRCEDCETVIPTEEIDTDMVGDPPRFIALVPECPNCGGTVAHQLVRSSQSPVVGRSPLYRSDGTRHLTIGRLLALAALGGVLWLLFGAGIAHIWHEVKP